VGDIKFVGDLTRYRDEWQTHTFRGEDAQQATRKFAAWFGDGWRGMSRPGGSLYLYLTHEAGISYFYIHVTALVRVPLEEEST
jgi:hypothetical protein